MEQKKKIRVILLIAAALLILIIGISLFSCHYFGADDPTQPSVPTTEPPTEPATEPPTEPATEPPTEPATEPPTEPATQPPTEPATEPPTQPPTGRPVAPTEPATEPPTEPVLSDPDQILSLVKGKLKNLAGQAKEVSSLSNPKTLTMGVDATDSEESAAQTMLERIKNQLGYEQSKADPDVAVGDPNPFTYEYKLYHKETTDGQHTFVMEYRFFSVDHQVPQQNYSTSRLVKDVCAYLDSIGKVKYDSQTGGSASKQAVIIPLEYTYETALSIAKAQAESASSQYRNYDFYYSTLTITTKGGQEQEALCFYIVNN